MTEVREITPKEAALAAFLSAMEGDAFKSLAARTGRPHAQAHLCRAVIELASCALAGLEGEDETESYLRRRATFHAVRAAQKRGVRR